MRQVRLADALVWFCTLSILSLNHPVTAQSRETVTYKRVGDVTLKADVYVPDGTGLRPIVAWFHGGALIMGHRSDVPKQFVALSEEHGFLLVSFDYRLGPQAKLADIVEDVKDGLDWIRGPASKQFRADPSRMVVAGASAGGYLAMMSGITMEPPPTAIVSYYGFGDIDGSWTTEPNKNFLSGTLISKEEAWEAVGDRTLSHTDANSRDGRWKFFVYLKQTGLWTQTISGFDPKTQRDKLTPFCPIRNLTAQYPPLLMLHGTADADVPHEQSVAMARELSRLDRPHELITLVGGRHGLWGGPPEKVLQAVDRSMQYIANHLSKP